MGGINCLVLDSSGVCSGIFLFFLIKLKTISKQKNNLQSKYQKVSVWHCLKESSWHPCFDILSVEGTVMRLWHGPGVDKLRVVLGNGFDEKVCCPLR